jgi:hypothetical protein
METYGRARVRQLSSVQYLTTGAIVDRTSASPEVKLRRLLSISGPLLSADEAGIILRTENMRGYRGEKVILSSKKLHCTVKKRLAILPSPAGG